MIADRKLSFCKKGYILLLEKKIVKMTIGDIQRNKLQLETMKIRGIN